jgi:hypothetical protein
MEWPSQVKTRITPRRALRAAAFAALLLLTLVSSQAAELPSGDEVLRLVRASESAQRETLAGQLRTRTAAGALKIPFQLQMERGTFTYRFTEPDERLILRLGETRARLQRIAGTAPAEPIEGNALATPIRGTDISYEDLAMPFLYWRNTHVAGEETVMTRSCWLVQAEPAGRAESQYDMVSLWVEKSGALLKAECYAQGQLVKKFRVVSVRPAREGGYTLKSLSIERPGKGAPTYLEITDH